MPAIVLKMAMQKLSVFNNKIILFTFLLSALTQAGLAIYTPAFLQISQQLQVSPDAVKFTLVTYLFGFGISQIFYGILSDRFGRKKCVLIGMLIFLIGCCLSIFSSSYFDLMMSRFLQGIGAGSGIALSRAIIQDSFVGMDYLKAATYLSSGFAFGVGLSPVIGGHLLDFFSWRSEFVFLFICGLLLLISLWIFLPETGKVLYPKPPIKQFLLQTNQNVAYILKNKGFYYYLVTGVSAYGIIVTYNTMTPFLFQKTLSINPSAYGWLTFFIAVTYYMATAFNRFILKHVRTQSIVITGIILIFFGGFSMLLIKLLFDVLNVYVVFIPLLIATFGQGLVWSISVTGALKDLSHIAGTAAALFSFLQMLLSTLISGIVAMPAENNQIPLAIVIITLAIISWASFHGGILKSKY